MKKSEVDKNYHENMAAQGFIKMCVWIPKTRRKDLLAYANGLRTIRRAKKGTPR